MIENSNPSYESMIKKLREIYQQTSDNKEDLNDKSVDVSSSKKNLDSNWISGISILDDTGEVPITPSSYGAEDGIAGTLIPTLASYTYQKTFNITKNLLPFLEYQNTFNVSGDTKLSGGFLFNQNGYSISNILVTVNGNAIWNGPWQNGYLSPNVFTAEQIAAGNALYTSPAWSVVLGTTNNSDIEPGSYPLIALTPTVGPVVYMSQVPSPNPNDYTFTSLYIINNGVFTNLNIEYITSYSFYQNNFYAFYDAAHTQIFSGPSDTITSLALVPPVIITTNIGGLPDITVVANQWYMGNTYDPFYIRQSKSTDTKESWQINYQMSTIVTTPSILQGSNVIDSTVYTWTLPESTWEVSVVNTPIGTVNFYKASTGDITAKVKVILRPNLNWNKTDKYVVETGD